MAGRRAAAGVFLAVSAWLGRAHAGDDELSLDLGGESSLELRRIPKGTFTQGSPPTETGREADESIRNVTITRSFWLAKIPVTRGQFARFVTETRHVTDAEKRRAGGFGWDSKSGALVQNKDFSWRDPGFPQKDEDPVVLVTFGDANAFTAWASRKTGRRVRLPTEAEWEYAARAATTTPWYGASKEEDALSLGWFKTNASSSTHAVGLKKPNAWGIFDMSGNVYQWCRDAYAPYPGGNATDPENATTAGAEPERRVLRGGSWLREPKRGRSSARNKSAPGMRSAENGFRIAVDDEGDALGGASSTDVAPAVPVGVGSSSSSMLDADASPSVTVPTRTSSEGAPWAMFFAPVASAGAAVLWVLARRARRSKETEARGEVPDVVEARNVPEPTGSKRSVDSGSKLTTERAEPKVPEATTSDRKANGFETSAFDAWIASTKADAAKASRAKDSATSSGTGKAQASAFDAWVDAAKAEASEPNLSAERAREPDVESVTPDADSVEPTKPKTESASDDSLRTED